MSEQGSGWFHRRGGLAEGGWETVVDERVPGWEHTGLRVARLAEGESIALEGTGVERLVVPLAGSFRVSHAEGGSGSGSGTETVTELAGRASVFDGPTDVLYLSSQATGVVTATSPARTAAAHRAPAPPTSRAPSRAPGRR